MKTLYTAALAAFVPFAALAQVPGITVTDAYVRSANPKSGAAFMTIGNETGTECRLKSVTADATDRAELHTNLSEDGVMKMVALDEIVVPAGGKAELARGGDHVMLMALSVPLNDGDTVSMVLDLGDCGTVPVAAKVDNKRAADAAPMNKDSTASEHAGHGAAPSH